MRAVQSNPLTGKGLSEEKEGGGGGKKGEEKTDHSFFQGVLSIIG